MIGLPKLGASARRMFRRNHRLVDLAAEILSSVGGNLAGEVQSGVVHGEQDAFDLQVLVQTAAELGEPC